MQSDGSDISEESASSVEIGVGRGYAGTSMDDRRGGAGLFGGDSYDFPIDFNQMPTAGTLNLDSRGAGTQRSTAKNASSKPKAQAKTQASSASATPAKMAGATVRRTALGGGLDDLSRFGIGSRGSPGPQPKPAKRDAMDFQKFLEESDSDEESSKPAAPQYRAAPSQNQQGDAESDSPVSSPAAKPAVLARSPAKVAQLASEEPKDTVPPRLNNITYDSPSPTSPRSGSGSRSGSPVAALPHSPRSVSNSIQSSERNSASAKSPKPQPRARSQSRSRSQSPSSSQPPAPRSRSPSPAPVSTESESSAPVERGSVFGNFRPMSDLVAATPAPSAKNSGMLGAGQRTATAAFSTQASTTSQPKNATQSAGIAAEVASPESTAAKRPSMHYEEDFEASSTGSALVQTPRAGPVPAAAAIAAAPSTAPTAAPTQRASVPATVPSAAASVRTEPKSQTYQEPSRDLQEDRGMPLRRSTRDVQVQASIPVDVGVQCDLLVDVPRAPGWATSSSTAPWGFSPWEQALSAGYPHPGPPAGFGPYGMMPMPPPGYFPWTPPHGPGFPFVAPWGKAGPTEARAPPPEPSEIAPGAPPAAPAAALWAMRMVDDSFKDQIELLRQAAQRHRSLLQKGRGPLGEVLERSGEVGAA